MSRKKEKIPIPVYDNVKPRFKVKHICDNCKFATFYNEYEGICHRALLGDKKIRRYQSCRKWEHKEQKGDIRL